MKKILSITAASTLATIMLTQGTFAKESTTEKSCCVLNDFCQNSGFNICISNVCSTESLKDFLSGVEFPCLDSWMENLPNLNLPEFEKPETTPPQDSTPDLEIPDISPETPEIKPEIPEQKPETPEQKPEIPEIDSDNNGNTNGNIQGENAEFISEVVRLVNVERTSRGLSALSSSNTLLNSAAGIRAKEQASLFSHTRPNGSNWDTVLRENGISYRSAGENVAYGQRTPSEVVNAWMNSEGHRANILNEGFTQIGVGVYKNGSTYYWSQLFIS